MPWETIEERIERVHSLLQGRRTAAQAHTSDRQLARAVSNGELVRLSRGWYVPRAAWQQLYSEDRHLLAVLAVSANATEPPVFSYYSAAVLHGLPLYRCSPARVHVTLARTGPRSHSSGPVHRHFERFDPAGMVTLGGLRCTSLARTVADIARVSEPRLALACADAALHRLLRPRRGGTGVNDTSHRQLLLDALDGMVGARGIGAARRVLALADARSESPIESVSRWYLLRLGFELDLQVRVPAPNSGSYWVDFEMVGHALLGEADGRAKYVPSDRTQQGPTSSTDTAHALYREKRRHDWIEGATKKRLIHWADTDLDTIGVFASRLRTFGASIPRPPPW